MPLSDVFRAHLIPSAMEFVYVSKLVYNEGWKKETKVVEAEFKLVSVVNWTNK